MKTGGGPATHFFRGLPINADGAVVFGAGPVAYWSSGIPFNAGGAVVGLQAADPSIYGPGATPYGPNGELCAVVLGTVAQVHQGVPYTAEGVYCASSLPNTLAIVAKDFTLTPAQVSSTSVGYRLSPAAGTLAPDNVYGGGSIATILATDEEFLQVAPVGGAPFPGISGNLTLQIGPYVGAERIILTWDVNVYTAAVPGIFALMQDYIGTPQAVRLAAAPA